MPRTTKPATVNFKDEAEYEATKAKAAAENLSLGNWFRVQSGLEPLQAGGFRASNVQTIRCDVDREKQTLTFRIVKGVAMAKCFLAVTKREPMTTKDLREAETTALHNLFREGAEIEKYRLCWEGKRARKASAAQVEAAKLDREGAMFENLAEEFELLPGQEDALK